MPSDAVGDDNAKWEWQPDQVLSDRYRVGECLQRSATCYLYRILDIFRNATHLALRPSRETLAEEGGREWFERFCRAALSVPQHRNLLLCNRLDHDKDVPCLIMEDIGGQTWDAAIAAGQLTELHTMLDVAIQVARALAWLHENGRIHANLKPANVILAPDGTAKIFKYGEEDTLTRAYASPEQMAGEHSLTRATDVWSWAASVLQMFCGMVIWHDGPRAPDALTVYVENGPAEPAISLMPVPVVELLKRCFQSDPNDRPASMTEIAEAAEKIFGDVTNTPYAAAATGQDEVSSVEETLVDPEPGPPSDAEADRRVKKPPRRRRFSRNRHDRDADEGRRRPHR